MFRGKSVQVQMPVRDSAADAGIGRHAVQGRLKVRKMRTVDQGLRRGRPRGRRTAIGSLPFDPSRSNKVARTSKIAST